MILNYFRIAWRNIIRQKLFSSINILGLALGIMAVAFISLYVMEELSYDRFHSKASQTYRLRHNYFMGDQDYDWHETAVPLAEVLRTEFPEVESVTSTTVPFPYSFKHKGALIDNIKTLHADADFFKAFDFKLVAGNTNEILKGADEIIISKEVALQLMNGHENNLYDAVIGESLSLENEVYTVTGVMESVPTHSHLSFDAILSIHPLVNDGYRKETWLPAGIVNYVVLKDNASPDLLVEKLKTIEEVHLWPQLQKHLGASIAKLKNNREQYGYYLEPLLDIHLVREGNLKYVIVFSVAGLLILLLAFINYANLFITSINNRIKEVGIRKSLGAGKRELVKQFLVESFLLCFIAFSLAISLVLLLIIPFNNFTGANLDLGLIVNPVNTLYIFGFLLFVILISSAYPAFYLSSFKAVNSMKGSIYQAGKGKISMQKPFIVFQYAISLGLIISFLAIHKQLIFMQEKDSGFNKENVVIMPNAYFFGQNQEVFKQEVLKQASVQSVSFSYAVPGSTFDALSLYKKAGEGKEFQFYWMHADDDFLKTYGIEVLEGRNFSKDFPSDSKAVLLNESAAAQMGKEGLIGTQLINHFDEKVEVIGIIKDFNFEHLKNEVQPLAIALPGENGSPQYVSVKLHPGNPQPVIQQLQQNWEAYNTGASFKFSFLDGHLETLYHSEKRAGNIIGLFSGLAVFISCFGLFGLITFTNRQRKKEIGIRKVLGATVLGITFLLSREFLYLIIAAFVVTVPVTYFMLDVWLQEFANRIELGMGIFLLSGIFIFVISALVLALQTIKSAMENPVDALSRE